MRDTPATDDDGYRILITDQAYQACKRYAEARGGNMVTPEAQQPDGQWPVVIDAEVLDTIMRLQAPGETPSDVILRICQHGLPKQS